MVAAHEPVAQHAARSVSIRINATSSGKYGIILIPKRARPFFREGYKVPFALVTSRTATTANLTSAPRGTPIGADAGSYLCGGIAAVFTAHPEWSYGMWLNFERQDDHVFLSCTKRPRFPHA